MPRSEFDSVELKEGPSLTVSGTIRFDAGERRPMAPMRVAWVVQQKGERQGDQPFTGGISSVNDEHKWGGATACVPSAWVEEPKLVVEAVGTVIVDRKGRVAQPGGPSVEHPDAAVWTQIVRVTQG